MIIQYTPKTFIREKMRVTFYYSVKSRYDLVYEHIPIITIQKKPDFVCILLIQTKSVVYKIFFLTFGQEDLATRWPKYNFTMLTAWRIICFTVFSDDRFKRHKIYDSPATFMGTCLLTWRRYYSYYLYQHVDTGRSV